MTETQQIRNHLTEQFLYPIRDPLWSHIYLSAGLKSIVASSRFQKLRGIKQLGPTYLVYPGATHTRLSHSLGVLEIAKRTLSSLLLSGEIGFLTFDGAKAFLAAALLHDLGHFPYAHSLKELPLKDHEQLTGETILSTELSSIIRNNLGTDPELVAAIVDLSMPYEDLPELGFYRNILSGVLDPDKLDYLNRDAFFCGVSYGTQDIDFVLSKLRYQPNVGLMLGIDGLTAVENLLFSKYLMYRTVYWHRTVRSATAMIKKAVFTAMNDGRIEPEDLYGLDDEDFARTFSSNDYPPFELIRRVSQRELHSLVFECPVDASPIPVSTLEHLSERTALESTVAAAISRRSGIAVPGDAVIIDLPEPISFEAELMIDTGVAVAPFPDSGSVFDRSVVSGFSRTLRKIRLFVDPRVSESIRDAASLLRSVAGSSGPDDSGS